VEEGYIKRETAFHEDSLAVKMAKIICKESKKRNMMRREADAPTGKNIAWHVSIV
jgi:hypothetical protein